jgi:phosphatidylglycerol---prolipoprotein diacylglyceryl transferase
MIPYFSQPQLSLGPISIHLFGVLVAIGILTALRLMRWRASRLGLDVAFTERMGIWVVLGGFAIAHIFDRLAYFPRETLADPLSLLRFWESISSFGGFLGGVLAALLFVRHRSDKWAYLDLIGFALPTGWFFGRIGCFVAFDHPGVTTSFFLAQRFKDGLVRHNLGLDEALYTLPLALLFLWLGRKGARRPGFFVGLATVIYAPARFLLDYLRIEDARYLHLTPGQYGAVLLALVGLKLLLWPPKVSPTEKGQGLDVRGVGEHVKGSDRGTGKSQPG